VGIGPRWPLEYRGRLISGSLYASPYARWSLLVRATVWFAALLSSCVSHLDFDAVDRERAVADSILVSLDFLEINKGTFLEDGLVNTRE
jgi:hypothetical protein